VEAEELLMHFASHAMRILLSSRLVVRLEKEQPFECTIWNGSFGNMKSFCQCKVMGECQ
jgi:hypothetical protein